MKTSKTLVALLAVGVVLAVGTASHGALLVYEPFDYAAGSDLAGQGGTGMEAGFATGSKWSTFVTPTPNATNQTNFQIHQQGVVTGIPFNNPPSEFPNPYTNTLTNLPTNGNFAGRNVGSNPGGSSPQGADHLEAWRALDPAVTATFADGTSTWFSFVAARGFNLNARAPTLAIGQGTLIEDRGNSATGPVIAVGGFNNAGGEFTAQYKSTAGNGGLTRGPTGSGNTWLGGTSSTSAQMVNILVARIDWGATSSDPDVVTFARFSDSDTLDLTTFNSKAPAPYGFALDQSTFTNLSVGGGRFLIDELRIGTTFDDVIGAGGTGPVIPEPATMLAVGLGITGLGGYIRKRRQA